jgi:hypothetical protein
MSPLGYSTGAIALSDFSKGLQVLSSHHFKAIELSALRVSELEPLIQAIPSMNLSQYEYISFHAPSAFSEEEEQRVIELLTLVPEDWPIVIHPDAIHDFTLWLPISRRLAVENMDSRKSVGKSVSELCGVFERLPLARMCLDLGHARQVDSSMIGAYLLLKRFEDRIVQLHVSEVDTMSRHEQISIAAEIAFSLIHRFIPPYAAIILESRVSEQEVELEANKVIRILHLAAD